MVYIARFLLKLRPNEWVALLVLYFLIRRLAWSCILRLKKTIRGQFAFKFVRSSTEMFCKRFRSYCITIFRNNNPFHFQSIFPNVGFFLSSSHHAAVPSWRSASPRPSRSSAASCLCSPWALCSARHSAIRASSRGPPRTKRPTSRSRSKCQTRSTRRRTGRRPAPRRSSSRAKRWSSSTASRAKSSGRRGPRTAAFVITVSIGSIITALGYGYGDAWQNDHKSKSLSFLV